MTRGVCRTVGHEPAEKGQRLSIDGENVKFYAEAEDILSHLPKLGIPMIMRKVEKGEGKGTGKLWSYPGMEKGGADVAQGDRGGVGAVHARRLSTRRHD
jgi:hypothetical protein